MAQLPNIIEKERSFFTTIFFAFKESIKGSKKYSTLRYIFTAIGGSFMFLDFGALAIVVNEFQQYGRDAHVEKIIFAFVLLVLSSILPPIFATFQEYFWKSQQNEMERHLQSLQFEKMRELDIGTIEQPEFQNILETTNMRGWSAMFSSINLISSSLRNIIALIIATVSLIAISPIVLVIILVGVLPTYFLERKNAVMQAKLWKDNAERSREWRAKTVPVYAKSSLIELKNFNLVKVFLKKWISIIGGFHEEGRILNKKTALNEVVGVIFVTIAYGIAFALVMYKVYVGALLVGALVYTFAVISRFQSAVQQLFESFGRLTEYKKNLDTMMDLLEMKPMIISGDKVINIDEFESLEIKNVSFAYPGSDKNVTKNLSLTISKGDNLAIVGLNGAGKTTLIKLITRVYDPTEGEILVNSINLKEYNLESWKRCLGILFQDYSTYSEESISENIMLGDITKHDQGLVEQSAIDSTAHEYIMDLPEKYEQRVGTEFRGGVELSKGQMQKLVLARIFYRNAPIVILDEPTAAIDALSEDAIFKSLKNNHNNQTRVIISHKFSNVRDADKIILIEHGTIIEQGSHDELMKLEKGRYRELFELQAEGYK